MRNAPELPTIPANVAVAFAAFPEPVRVQLLEVRRLIFATAAETSGVGTLTETLKWGEPAYLTEATGSGSTIRLGLPKSPRGMSAVLFNCRTTLVETFRYNSRKRSFFRATGQSCSIHPFRYQPNRFRCA